MEALSCIFDVFSSKVFEFFLMTSISGEFLIHILSFFFPHVFELLIYFLSHLSEFPQDHYFKLFFRYFPSNWYLVLENYCSFKLPFLVPCFLCAYVDASVSCVIFISSNSFWQYWGLDSGPPTCWAGAYYLSNAFTPFWSVILEIVSLYAQAGLDNYPILHFMSLLGWQVHSTQA
jgi:hypothetical protein